MAKQPPEPEISAELLGEHLNSIRINLLEIRSFETKTIRPNPFHQITKPVDIEEAWPDCRKLFIEMYAVLNDIASHFNIEPGGIYENSGFKESIDSFINQQDVITFGIADALGTGEYEEEELVLVDGLILNIQQSAILMRKYVLEEFKYSTQK